MRFPGAVPLLLLASVALVELPVSAPSYSRLACLASPPEGRRMSRSAAGGSAGKPQTGGGGEQQQRAEHSPGLGGFPMFSPPGMFPGFSTLDKLYAEMMENVERVRSEMERLYYAPFGMMTPYPALGPGGASVASPAALRAGTSGHLPLAVPGRPAGGGSLMPYYRGGSGGVDAMSPFYSPLFSGGSMMPFTRAAGAVVPRVDFQDLGNEYLMQADVPGIDKSNVKIQVQNGVLHISGEQQQETKEQQKGYFMQERYRASFSRSLPLPEDVREDEIRATMKDGVLQVHLPKIPSEKMNVKKIHVE